MIKISFIDNKKYKESQRENKIRSLLILGLGMIGATAIVVTKSIVKINEEA